ncbi:MAG: patatin family protein [Vicinamibacteria bacterium]
MNGTSRALVLEGGGMRGTYTAGVLEAFAENGRSYGFDFVVACSAGACTAASFLAGQPRRNRTVYLDYLAGRKFIRWYRLLNGGDVMDIDYLTDEVHGKLCPLDLEALKRSPILLHIGVTDAETGNVRYLNNHEDDLLTALRATCALPLFYRRPVVYQGRRYVDGGVGDPVPVLKALALGAKEVVVVLTSSIEKRGVRKWWSPIGNHVLSTASGVRKALNERHRRYQEAAAVLTAPPTESRMVVLRPSQPLGVGRATRDREKLERACDLGYEDGRTFLRGQ